MVGVAVREWGRMSATLSWWQLRLRSPWLVAVAVAVGVGVTVPVAVAFGVGVTVGGGGPLAPNEITEAE